MYMGDSYYDNQISSLERDLAISKFAMDTSLEFINFKNDREKGKIRERIRNITTSSLDQLGTARKKLNKDLDRIKNHSYISEFDVEDYMTKHQDIYRVDLEYYEASDISKVIANNPIAALKQYSMEYISIKRQIEQVKKDKELDKTEEENRRKQGQVYEEPIYDPVIEYEPIRHKQEEIPFSGFDDEESIKLVQERIDKELTNKDDFYGFSYEEKKRIQELYPELSHYSGYYSVDNLEKSIVINKIANKETIKVEDIMEMGLLTIEVVSNELLQNNQMHSVDLFEKLDVKNSLNKYKSTYNKFENYYKSLSPQQKKMIKARISYNLEYSDMFGDLIATPDEITSIINKRVTNYISDNYLQFYDYSKKDFYLKTAHATKYMSIEEIVNLYKNIEYREQSKRVYATKEEDRVKLEQAKREYLEQLQRDFANVILTKLERHNKDVDYFKLSDEERKEYDKKTNQKLASIINDLFKEQPLSSSLQKALTEIEEGRSESLVETYEAKEAVTTQVYGLSRVKQTFAKMTGKWSRYLMLMDKDELSKEEQEELKGMFR